MALHFIVLINFTVCNIASKQQLGKTLDHLVGQQQQKDNNNSMPRA
jgi:hypothetical protein